MNRDLTLHHELKESWSILHIREPMRADMELKAVRSSGAEPLNVVQEDWRGQRHMARTAKEIEVPSSTIRCCTSCNFVFWNEIGQHQKICTCG